MKNKSGLNVEEENAEQVAKSIKENIEAYMSLIRADTGKAVWNNAEKTEIRKQLIKLLAEDTMPEITDEQEVKSVEEMIDYCAELIRQTVTVLLHRHVRNNAFRNIVRDELIKRIQRDTKHEGFEWFMNQKKSLIEAQVNAEFSDVRSSAFVSTSYITEEPKTYEWLLEVVLDSIDEELMDCGIDKELFPYVYWSLRDRLTYMINHTHGESFILNQTTIDKFINWKRKGAELDAKLKDAKTKTETDR